jgi:pimeloyl-ACP methyl ester carboxylesterase
MRKVNGVGSSTRSRVSRALAGDVALAGLHASDVGPTDAALAGATACCATTPGAMARAKGPRAAYTLEQLADDAAALMDHVGIARATWVGFSMGGMIGQVFALRHASRVQALVLADTTSEHHATPQAIWDERIRVAHQQGMAPLVQPAIGRWFTQAFREAHPDTVAHRGGNDCRHIGERLGGLLRSHRGRAHHAAPAADQLPGTGDGGRARHRYPAGLGPDHSPPSAEFGAWW